MLNRYKSQKSAIGKTNYISTFKRKLNERKRIYFTQTIHEFSLFWVGVRLKIRGKLINPEKGSTSQTRSRHEEPLLIHKFCNHRLSCHCGTYQLCMTRQRHYRSEPRDTTAWRSLREMLQCGTVDQGHCLIRLKCIYFSINTLAMFFRLSYTAE